MKTKLWQRHGSFIGRKRICPVLGHLRGSVLAARCLCLLTVDEDLAVVSDSTF